MSEDSKVKERKEYKKNENYDQEVLKQIMRTYRIARKYGNEILKKEMLEKLYFFGRSYVYSVMWETYPTLMKNPFHREDIVHEIWCVVFDEIENFDCDKGSLTTFMLPWIRHVVTEYCSHNFHKTTPYYSDGIRKVSAALNLCHEKGITANVETIQKLTNLRIPTIKKCIDQLAKKDTVSYEVLSESGFEQSSSLYSPESIFFRNEETKSFNDILEESLTE